MNPGTTDILARAGFPPRTLVLDFETYFDKDYTLKKLSPPEYIADERFEVLGVAWKLGDAPAQFSSALPTIALPVTVVGHHLNFDAMVLAMRYGVHPSHMIDTVSLMRSVFPKHRAGLADVAKVLGLPAKGDTNAFKGLRRAGMTPQQLDALAGYATNDADLEHAALHRLLPEIDNPEIELPLIHHTVTLATQPVLDWDAAGAAALRGRMRGEQQAALDRVAWVHDLIA